jgi:hypothetical protein
MRQQFTDASSRMRRQAREDVLQIGIRIVPVELGRLNQAHVAAARLPARNEDADRQFFLPMAIDLIWFSH